MHVQNTRKPALTRLMQCLLALPFVFSQLFAQGTMLSGGLEVVLCSADGPVTVVVAADGSQVPAHEGDAPCLWALIPTMDAPEPLVVPDAIQTEVALLTSLTQQVTLPAGLHAPLPPARAPPVQSI